MPKKKQTLDMSTEAGIPSESTESVVATPAVKTAYRVFNDRMDVVAQSYDLDEAKALAQQFNGTYRAL